MSHWMDKATKPDPVDWAAVQMDYEQSNGTLGAICARYSISAAQLRFRRERHGWALRHDWSVRVAPLITRMMRVLDGHMRKLEQHMSETVDKDAALLGTMTKTLEKLLELDERHKAKQPARQKEMSDIKRRLITRIEQLKAG